MTAVFAWWEETVRLHALRNALEPAERMGPLLDAAEAEALARVSGGSDPAGDQGRKQVAGALQQLRRQIEDEAPLVAELPAIALLAGRLRLSRLEALLLAAAMFPEVSWRHRRLLCMAQGAQERPFFTLEMLGRILAVHPHKIADSLSRSVLTRLRLILWHEDPSTPPTVAGRMIRAHSALFLAEPPPARAAAAADAWLDRDGLLVIRATAAAGALERVRSRAGRRPVTSAPPPPSDGSLAPLLDAGLAALLADGVLYVDAWDAWCAREPHPAILAALAELPLPIALRTARAQNQPRAFGARPVVLESLMPPDFRERLELWREVLGDGAQDLAGLEEVAEAHAMHRAEIESVARQARWRAADRDAPLRAADLHQAAQEFRRSEHAGLARVVQPQRDWDDLILPGPVIQRLREISRWMRHRHRVLDEWGFRQRLSSGRGVTALFSGPPGTGKTLAAEVLARDLDTYLVHVDLALVVNKYVGETEKMLKQLFESVERGVGVLFFDEADALFGRRTEVKDAHDRYANQEISYLLQLLEEFQGLAILTTNLKRNVDEAFLRRLQFNIPFARPGEPERRRIWRHFLHEHLPQDRGVDVAFLAGQFALTGASIRNAVVRAAFRAAAADEKVGMSHLLGAVQSEYQQLEQAFDARTLGPYAEMLSEREPLASEAGAS